jgi:hypothetical protein
MTTLMKEFEAYPEGPVAVENWRTPCHAAAECGNSRKLKVLMSDVNYRYKRNNSNNTNANVPNSN